MVTTLVVFARIVTNPLSNVFQKRLAQRSAEPIFIIAATHGLLTALALPLLFGRPLDALGGPFWANMLTAVAFAVAGNVLLLFPFPSPHLSFLPPLHAHH